MIRCPSWFDTESKKEWKRIIKLLDSENKNFTEKDLKALEGYCVSYADWKRCTEIIRDIGYKIGRAHV